MATFCKECEKKGLVVLAFSKGFCKSHQYLKKGYDKRSINQRAIDRQKSKITPITPTPECYDGKETGRCIMDEVGVTGECGIDKVKKAEMDLFWLTAEKELAKKPYCVECGAFIPKKYYRAATAHVLPKRKEYGFPSIAANQINRLFLGAGCSCHGRYDRSWEDAAKMNVFPLAIEIFKKLYPLIHKSERKNIPEVLMQEIEPNG